MRELLLAEPEGRLVGIVHGFMLFEHQKFEISAQVVVLAAFLPVLAGQSGNTGCQSLAVTLRALTLDEFKPGVFRQVLAKETLLGTINCAIVGLVTAPSNIFLTTATDVVSMGLFLWLASLLVL